MSDDVSKAKELICILLAAAGGRLRLKTALNKAFYYAHLYYWKDEQKVLTDYPIVRMPNGPSIDNADQLLHELQAEAWITIDRETLGPYPEFTYTLKRKFEIDPDDPRHRAAQQAIKWIEGKDAAQLSEETHDYSRSWQQACDGQELNIYIDLLDDEEYRRMRRQLGVSEANVHAVFSE
ncbi:MAG TPA: type II toxin-antitoxin system antitoxin SocA domain-containing protein [Chthonomonadaceae bacterium]|nr:type II toxin-antitoxin system antitoxin SocA domain-containing protein [Chthonomonadaceae bacterium]